MNKIKYVFIFMFLYFIFSAGVGAETYQCEYTFESEDETYTLEFDTTKDTVRNLNEKEDKNAVIMKNKYQYNYKFYDKEISSYDVNTCPILYLSKTMKETKEGPITVITYTYTIYSDSFVREQGGDSCVSNRDAFCFEIFLGKDTTYWTGVLTDNEINKNNTQVSICPSYELIDGELQEAINNQENCSGQNCAKFKTIANQKLKTLKETCNNILSYRNYYIEEVEEETTEAEDGESSNGKLKDACIISCLNDLPERIKEIEGNKSDTGECGFSGRLMVWFSNILRWIKYLLPVAVIVLAILDFIKAIGADKDDEMKKAQGRFVKRLIAAALVFIIPLIIEFILDKMGFGYNDCGLF